MTRLTDILRDTLLEAKSPKVKPVKVKPAKVKLNKGRIESTIRPAVREGVENSIKNRWLLYIDYEGDLESKPFKRWCQPYLLGIRKETGNLTLRCFVYKGASVKGNLPAWKTVRLDRIANLAPLTAAHFSKPEANYNPNDKHMSKILLRVNFDDNGGKDEPEEKPTTPGGSEPSIDINSPEIKKTAQIVRNNVKDGTVDFDALEKVPEFRDSKMKRALQVIKKLLSRAGKSIVKGLQNLHLKEDIDETD